jgi:hypothetical protein
MLILQNVYIRREYIENLFQVESLAIAKQEEKN